MGQKGSSLTALAPQAVLSDADSGIHLSATDRTPDTSDSDATGLSLRGLSSLRTPSPLRRSSPHRSASPRRSLSPVFSDSTLVAVQSALQRRQLQLQVREEPRSSGGGGVGATVGVRGQARPTRNPQVGEPNSLGLDVPRRLSGIQAGQEALLRWPVS